MATTFSILKRFPATLHSFRGEGTEQRHLIYIYQSHIPRLPLLVQQIDNMGITGEFCTTLYIIGLPRCGIGEREKMKLIRLAS